MSRVRPPDRGQATVELAMLLPVFVILVLLVAHAAVVARDEVLVTHAAREGARAAAVEDDPAAITRAAQDAGPLEAERMKVTVHGREGRGSRVTVRVTYRSGIDIPFLGPIVVDDLRAQATMRVER